MSAPATAFARLHPSLRYVIETSLGWRTLRPIQEEAIGAILSGATTLVLAPTAGGKTEAAVFPLLSRILDDTWAPTSVLYIAPLRALLNDLGERLSEVTGQLGLSVGVWHGDVGQSQRRRIAAAPPDVLLTTPESLEVLLSMASPERRALLLGLRAVVVDEIHAFFGVDRGTQLLSLLERLTVSLDRDVQRIGLSATIGNPVELLEWLRGSTREPGKLVQVARSAERAEVFELHYRESLPGVVAEIARFVGEKTIVFCRTRSDVEELTHALAAAGHSVWAHHSALSRETREDAETEFRAAAAGALVATSTLELGIDIGDLDRVVQIDAPTTVASMLQRLGRTGRRGGPAMMTFVATNQEQLMLAGALLKLHAVGWVEPLVPPWQPFPVLAQQLLATVLQTGGLSRSELADRLSDNAAFTRIGRPDIDRLIGHLLATAVLQVVDGSLTFGEHGERRFTYREFTRLASVFQSTESVTVQASDREVGTLDRWFVDEMIARNRSTFLLNGRAWHVVGWPESGSDLAVTPAAVADAPLFVGSGLVLSRAVMQSIRGMLASTEPLETALPDGTRLSEAAKAQFAALRAASEPQTLARAASSLIDDGATAQLFTYAGLRANRLVSDLIFEPIAVKTTITNTGVRYKAKDVTANHVSTRFTALSGSNLEAERFGLPSHAAATAKFFDLLDAAAQRRFSHERLYDVAGAVQTFADGMRVCAT